MACRAARAWSHAASRFRRAVAPIGSASPIRSAGRIYVPEEDVNYRAEGIASWYGDDFHGRLTANGEVFDMASLTAAHPTLPIPSYARVTNLGNGKSLIVRVNDRGPYHGNRLIDVSNKAAELLEFKGNGTAKVRVEYVGRAPLEGSDDRQLVATLRTGEPAPSPSLVRVASARSFVPDMQGGRADSRRRSAAGRTGRIRSAIPRPMSPRSTRPRKCRHRAVRADGASANPRAVSYEADGSALGRKRRPMCSRPRGPAEVLTRPRRCTAALLRQRCLASRARRSPLPPRSVLLCPTLSADGRQLVQRRSAYG